MDSPPKPEQQSSESGGDQPPVVLNIANGSFTFENPRSREGLDESTCGEVIDFKLDNINVTVQKVSKNQDKFQRS